MKRGFLAAAGLSLMLAVLAGVGQAGAANNFPDQTSGGSIGLQGEISQAAPTQGATITVPSNGATFSSLPITVSGLCPSNLLIKIFSNNVFVGSTFCSNGSYSLKVDLFNGQNQLVARDYDSLDQAGPDSNTVNVTFNDVQFAEFGTHVQLTSNFAERGAPPNQELDWPIILSGGNGPYAISVDWGDGSPTTLFSQAASGTFTIRHTYKSSGIYTVIVKATDKNNGTAFLQLIAVASGAKQSNAKGGTASSLTKVKILWWPALLMVPLILATFWVGRRYELYVLRKQLEKERDNA
ncbi:MAG TPA: PKD domain-containing protein [Candidatus Saccharimonadales bacterium]|nr:PKD domain-containing protein [Candidatus Saccharimonadales bacterium]